MGYFLGVDIGTTYTAAAVVESGRAEIVTLGNRTPTVPTVVYLGPDEQLLVGEAANRRAITEPGRIARQFKRRVGDSTPILVGGSPMSPQALMARVLRWVIDRVSEEQGRPPDHVALTHPANWAQYKLDLVEQALRLSNLERWSTISEPEAAAVYYSSIERVGTGDVVAVYDLGGGTFDAAVLRQDAHGFRLLGSPEGIEHLGGIDVDEAVFAHVAASVPGFDDLDPDDTSVLAAVARLRQDCTEAKEALSMDRDCTIPVLIPGIHSEVVITRSELEAMLRPWLGDTVEALRRALVSAGVEPSELAAVLLVGGSSRIPLVSELVSRELGRPVAVDAHPKHAVALGAAVIAHQEGTEHAVVPGADVSVATPPPTPSAAEAGEDVDEPLEPVVEPAVLEPPAPDPPVSVPPVAEPPTPEPEPRPEPEPVPEVAASAPARDTANATLASSSSDVPPVVPPGTDAAPGDAERRRPVRLLVGAGAGAVVVLAVAGFAFFGGGDGDDKDGDTDVAATDVESTTSSTMRTTTTEPPVEVGPSGRGVRIDSIRVENGTYLVDYRTAGYEPLISEDPASHHIHFFFDSVPVEEAGRPVGSGAGWILWDVPSPFDGYRVEDRPDEAEQMCVLVADYEHRVELETGNCWALP